MVYSVLSQRVLLNVRVEDVCAFLQQHHRLDKPSLNLAYRALGELKSVLPTALNAKGRRDSKLHELAKRGNPANISSDIIE